jgi:putative serine protease PepD
MAGALLVAALAGGTVAVIGAALVGTGEHTTTIRELVQPPTSVPGDVSQTSRERPLTVRAIYDRDAPGVVQVTTTTKIKLPQTDWFGNPFGPPGTEVQRSLGSGFVIDKAGHIVTNYHVVRGANTIQVSFSNNERFKAKVVGVDPSTDVAVLRVEVKSRALKSLPLGNSESVRVGDQVIAIGNPFGLDRSVTSGIVSAVQRRIEAPNQLSISHVIQTDAALNHGNSGGPLLNAQGQVVGVNAQIKSDSGGNEGVGFSIPSSTVKSVASQLIASGKAVHAYLGVSIDSTAANALLAGVQDNTPAASAGLKKGDVITTLNGTTIASGDDLSRAIDAHKPGDKVSVTYKRGGSEHSVTVTLGTRPN